MKKIIVFIIMLVMMPLNIKAATLNASCKGAAAGGTTTCSISVSGTKVAGVQANIGISSNASITSISKASGWDGTISTSKISYYRAHGVSSANVATINIKLSSSITSSATLTLSGIVISDENSNTENLSAKTITIPVLSNNNNLSALSLNNASIKFSKNVTSYSATINASTTTITASKEDNSSSFVSGYGSRTVNLNYGSNTIYVKVKAASGAIKTYTLNITRPDNRNANGNLKSLKVGGKTIEISKNEKVYSVNVDSDIDKITIDVEAEHAKASFVPKYGSRTVDLVYGDNEILVQVLAENQSVTTYKVIVNRKDIRDENNNLKTLKLSSGKISFSKEYTNYNASVLYDVTKVDVTAIPESNKATVEIESPEELIVGNNIIKVNVKAENGKVKTYTITLARLDVGEVIPSAEIKNIEIEGHKFEYDPKVLTYRVKIENEKSLKINVTPLVEGTRVKIIGNNDLKNNSSIVIVSISTEGEVNYYQIIVERVSNFTIFIAFLGSIVMICVVAIMFLRSKSSKNARYKIKKGTKLYE